MCCYFKYSNRRKVYGEFWLIENSFVYLRYKKKKKFLTT